MVRTYDVLALPTASRWGATLVGAYINERGAQYNLLDAIFASTDDAVVSLATLRDAGGKPFDLQIVHHNKSAGLLLKAEGADLLWRRIGEGDTLLASLEIMDFLLKAVSGGRGEQLEIESDGRHLRLSATAFADVVSLTISDVTVLKRRDASFRLLFDNNPMPMWVFDAESKEFLSVNDAAVQHYGYSRATFLRMKLHEIWPRGRVGQPRRGARTHRRQPITPRATGGICAPTAARSRCSPSAAASPSTIATAIWSRWSTSPNGARPRRGSPTWRTMTGSPICRTANISRSA